MVQIRLQVDGITQTSRNMRVLIGTLDNSKTFIEDALDIVEKRSDELFETRGRNVQKAPKWRELSASTRKARANRSGYYRRSAQKPSLLRWTGRLQDDRTRRIGKDKGSFFFNAPYAVYHQRGSRKLPARAIIDISNATNIKIVKQFQRTLQKKVGIFGRQF